MKACEQAGGLSIYQHGVDVAERYEGLYNMLGGIPPKLTWSIPDQIIECLQLLRSLSLSPEQARNYHVFHDCGKPQCLTIDADGKRHFPNHAQLSTEIYQATFPNDLLSADLISKDMNCHTLRGEEACEFAKDLHAPTLCLTAWAELHANASALFGGFESDSFKIKRKRLIQMTKLIKAQQNHLLSK